MKVGENTQFTDPNGLAWSLRSALALFYPHIILTETVRVDLKPQRISLPGSEDCRAWMGNRPLSHLTCRYFTTQAGIPQLERPPAWSASSLVLLIDKWSQTEKGSLTEFTRFRVERTQAPGYCFAGVLDLSSKRTELQLPLWSSGYKSALQRRDTAFDLWCRKMPQSSCAMRHNYWG